MPGQMFSCPTTQQCSKNLLRQSECLYYRDTFFVIMLYDVVGRLYMFMFNDMGERHAEEHTAESGPPTNHVRFAEVADIPSCKQIADDHRSAFGFLTRGIFSEAVSRRRLLVVETKSGDVVGFVRFNHRVRGTETAIYDIGVSAHKQRQGFGRALVLTLAAQCYELHRSSIMLRCPEDLPANSFYARVGFQFDGTESGRRRRLHVWRFPIETHPCNS